MLVTALLLVGLFAASVLAQEMNAKPTVTTQINDREITIVAGTATNVVDFTDADGNGGAAFTDSDDGTELAYTVVTSKVRVASASLASDPITKTDGDIASVNVDNTVADEWWDTLGNGDADASPQREEDTNCSKRAAALGFTAGAPFTGTGTPPEGTPLHRAGRNLDAAETPEITAIGATGLCQDFATITGDADEVNGDDAADIIRLQAMIIQAFHWDMLSGAEMVVAAQSGGLSSQSGYAKRFAGLSATQRSNVEGLYTAGVLARGGGNLTLTNNGIDSDRADELTDGEPGTAEITVKVSDATGRLIPPGDGSKTVGQSFDLTASRTPTGNLTPFGTPTALIRNW